MLLTVVFLAAPEHTGSWGARRYFCADEGVFFFLSDRIACLVNQRMLEQAQAIIDKQGLGDEGKQDASEEALPKASKSVRWDDSGVSHSAAEADKADADASASESDSGSSGADDDQPKARSVSKNTTESKQNFSFSFSDDDATVGRRTKEGSKKNRADAKKRRQASEDASDDEASGSEEGQENADPASSTSKRRKARTSESALTTQEKGRLKAQAKVVAYERALQVAELLA